MKKYETPKIEVIEFETTDIIQTSGEATPQTLSTVGFSLGGVNATDIFK